MPEYAGIYIDSNPFIYAIEGEDALAKEFQALFAKLRDKGRVAITSELTLAEVLPKAPSPVHRRQYFDLLIWSRVIELRPITREILVETASYRKSAMGDRTMPKLPDAIHAVTAIANHCFKYLSADKRALKLPKGFELVNADANGVAALVQGLL